MALRLIYYYAIIIVVLAISFWIGHLFHSVFKPTKNNTHTFFSAFKSTVIGLVIIVSIYSIITTTGRTVSWIYILLLFGYGYFFKSDSSTDNTPVLSGYYLKALLSLFLIGTFFFLIYLSSLLNFKTLRFTDTFCDWQFYSKTSQYLNLGFESTGQFDSFAFGGTFTPYHYFEIWIAAFISNLFCVPSQISISIIMPSILGCITFAGLLGFSHKISFKKGLLALLLMFLSSASFFSSFLKRIGISLNIIAGDTSSVVSSFKLYPYLIFFIFSLHYLLQRNFRLSLICLLFIPVASFISAPSILPFVTIAIIYIIVRKKEYYNDLKLPVFFAIYIFSFLCYYLFFWDKQPSNTFIFNLDVWTRLLSVFNPIFMIFCILPFLLFLFAYKKYILINHTLKKVILISYFIILFTAIGVVVLTSGYYDGIQFFINIFTPLTIVLISLFVLRLKLVPILLYKILYSLFLFLVMSSMFYSVKFMCFQSHKEKQDAVFINKIIHEIGTDDGKPVFCGFIHSKAYYSENYLRALSKVTMVGEAVDAYRNNFLQVGLSDYVALDWLQNECDEDPNAKKAILARIPEGTFYKYVELEKKADNFVSLEQSQLNFIMRYNIDYIFIQNDVSISNQLSKKIKLIASEDKSLGYSFYRILKQEISDKSAKSQK